MATFTMVPNGDHHSAWRAYPFAAGGQHYSRVNSNDDSSFISENADGDNIFFHMEAPSVAEASITSITSVQVFFRAAYTHASNTTDLDVSITVPDCDAHTITVSGGSSYALYNNTARTNMCDVAETAYSYSDLEDLQIMIEKNGAADFRRIIRVSYIYVVVTYVEAVVGYENNVMGIDSGDISIVNGIATADISKVNGV